MATPQDHKGILLEVGTNEVEFLRFGLGEQTFGINVTKIRQVLVYRPETIVEIPGTPETIRGQYCFRGDPIPVIDLALYLKKNVLVDRSRRLLLVCEFSLTKVGFVVDSVDRILRCSWDSFRPLEHSNFAGSSSSIVGTVLLQNEMIPIIDVELALAELIPSAGIELTELSEEDKVSTVLDRASVQIVSCEDSSIVQKALSNVLASAGFSKVKMFASALDALTYVKKTPQSPPDIIISDIEMPRMDGLTFCRELRKLGAFQGVPFVFFSSTITEEMRRKCDQVGGNAALSKPEIAKIVKTIDELVHKVRTTGTI